MFSSKVSQLWNLALVTSNVHNDRRLSWIAIRYNFLTFLVSAQVSTILIFSQETRSRERWSHSSRQTWPPLAKVGAASVGQICYTLGSTMSFMWTFTGVWCSSLTTSHAREATVERRGRERVVRRPWCPLARWPSLSIDLFSETFNSFWLSLEIRWGIDCLWRRHEKFCLVSFTSWFNNDWCLLDLTFYHVLLQERDWRTARYALRPRECLRPRPSAAPQSATLYSAQTACVRTMRAGLFHFPQYSPMWC